ncbi:MAG: hypothetical protein CMM44_04745 [Rhodospirillaceae bacterium]|nr:hypothetical protein [Rhodospirillaceae bacterium]
MTYYECIKWLASRWTDELVVTSAGTSSEFWYDITGDTERVFYLEASMSLSSMFAAGIAYGLKDKRVWAFSGDGAFVMNAGMLAVEQHMALPNLKHFMISNRVYGSTSNVPLPGRESNDYAAIARAFGVSRVFSFKDLNDLKSNFGEAVSNPGYSFIHLEVQPVNDRPGSPPMDGPELKFRFGRNIENISNKKVFSS